MVNERRIVVLLVILFMYVTTLFLGGSEIVKRNLNTDKLSFTSERKTLQANSIASLLQKSPLVVIAGSDLQGQLNEDQIKARLSTSLAPLFADMQQTGQESPLVVIVPQNKQLPVYQSLPFHTPEQILGITNAAGEWFPLTDAECACDSQQLIASIKKKVGEQQQSLLGVLSLRTALYHYYLQTKTLPKQLKQLTQAAPNNFLSQIPEPPAGNNEGWIYNPAAFESKRPWESMEQVVMARGLQPLAKGLQPIELDISIPEFRMHVVSGPHLLRSYPVALGTRNQTPQGDFTIALKVNKPKSATKVYGTRALALSNPDYAIHGTNDPSSIGKAVSKGCIRLFNRDVEELYSLVPLGTKVHIGKTKLKSSPTSIPGSGKPYLLPVRPNEQSSKSYHWRG
ncbi:L,D-transpeptidase [Brevibacillus laterosporus]|uniref:L,D-transpeptidase n=1 Tax=Brevibacillus laterosporus TaxID=1465 RepID=A0A502J4X8_BRELA|nr:L,D-transpeptidase [Brevibacillus laterosporus]QDX93513.1 L,D-transpeptidase [Brevibacillus laterosporus]TPG92656.1 L,D-transpeptidase [Brevibacillus laterosporus]